MDARTYPGTLSFFLAKNAPGMLLWLQVAVRWRALCAPFRLHVCAQLPTEGPKQLWRTPGWSDGVCSPAAVCITLSVWCITLSVWCITLSVC